MEFWRNTLGILFWTIPHKFLLGMKFPRTSRSTTHGPIRIARPQKSCTRTLVSRLARSTITKTRISVIWSTWICVNVETSIPLPSGLRFNKYYTTDAAVRSELKMYVEPMQTVLRDNAQKVFYDE
ncbi:hypothetical protein PM082_020061 [Marasmius tenuissimus]|nr:hypothetical protein PM082_020061 [Marasmius tenuissimus]